MSRFFSEKYAALDAYVPGEQPKDMQYIKLNTNESPFPPPAAVVEAAKTEAGLLHLYSDPECTKFIEKATEIWKVKKGQILATNGSDEILDLAFGAFCSKDVGAVFADITYGFYPVFADRQRVPYRTVPLREDFSIRPADYFRAGGTVFLANPNAPTGMALPWRDIEKIAVRNPHNVVVVDEAYVDFGGESAVRLTNYYDNLLVVGTFSKSRSMAGARLGFAIGCPALIQDLETVRNSTNPYNVNAMTQAMGIGTLLEEEEIQKRCATVARVREEVAAKLQELGFTVLPSRANFLFARHGGAELDRARREKGFLVRHFDRERIRDFVRVTVGKAEDMQAFLGAAEEILAENAKKD